MLTEKTISIVVTCYKDEGSIVQLLRRLNNTMEKITPNWEVIYVNDHSPDNSEKVLLELSVKNPRITVISHARNFGAQIAFSTGLLQAVGDAVVIMDGDLQDPPELIEEFVKLWLSGYDVVCGIRAVRHEGIIRNIGYKIFYRIFQKIAYIPIHLDAGEFSLMDRVVVDVINECPEQDRLIRGLRSYAGFKQTGVPYERPPRYSGESTQSLLSYITWAYKSFTSYSLFPLRLINITAFFMVGLLVLMLFSYLTIYIFFKHSDIPKGFMTLLSITLGLGSIIMFSLGIIGEYLGRLFVEIKKRPHQVISLLVNDHRPEPRPWLGRVGKSQVNIFRQGKTFDQKE